MTRRAIPFAALVVLFASSAPARADDLTGAYHLLCSTGKITLCYETGTCEAGDAEELNVPQFIEVGEIVRVDTAEGKYLERAK